MNRVADDREQLVRRADRLARLRHPNLVRMLPVPGAAGYTPVLHQGRRLAHLVSAGKPPELVQLVSYLIDVLAGLSVLHDDVENGKRFVHGEVSPEHVLIGEDGVARLVPILSRHVLAVSPSTNGYGAPELLLGEAPDLRADLFSVGVMLWEALAGARLFADPSAAAVRARLEREKLRPPPVPLAHPWAAPLCLIAERAISPYPVLRFQSAVELSNALGRALEHRHAEPQRDSRDGRDSWEDDTPTAASVPRPRQKLPRSITPLASVLDLPAGAEPEPPVDSTAALERDVVRSFRRGPVGKAGIFAAVAAAAIGLLAAVNTRHGATRAAAAGVVRGATLAAELSSPAPVTLPPPAEASSPAANSAPAEVASPLSSAARSPRLARPSKASRPRAPGREDYGI